MPTDHGRARRPPERAGANVPAAQHARPDDGLQRLARSIGNRNMAMLARQRIRWRRERRDGQNWLAGGKMALVDPDPAADQGATQQMVPSAKDLEELKREMADRPEWRGLDPVQAWALLAAEKKGRIHAGGAKEAAAARLQALGEQIGGASPYDPARDLKTILDFMHYKMRLATNFKLTTPIAKQGSDSTETLIELMLRDPEGKIRNMWETGASQASADPNPRGDVERQMGYAPALRPTHGTYGHNPNDPKYGEGPGHVDKYSLKPGVKPSAESGLDAALLPKYAALVTPYQPAGVGPRYGKTVIYWKPTVRRRATMTAGDSWGMSKLEATRSYVSALDVAWIFAKSELARLIAAAATAGAHDPEKWRSLSSGKDRTNEYIEVQIHGPLSWADAEEIVVNWGAPGAGERGYNEWMNEADAEELVEQLRQLKRKGGYSFKVSKGIQTVEPK